MGAALGNSAVVSPVLADSHHSVTPAGTYGRKWAGPYLEDGWRRGAKHETGAQDTVLSSRLWAVLSHAGGLKSWEDEIPRCPGSGMNPEASLPHFGFCLLGLPPHINKEANK